MCLARRAGLRRFDRKSRQLIMPRLKTTAANAHRRGGIEKMIPREGKHRVDWSSYRISSHQLIRSLHLLLSRRMSESSCSLDADSMYSSPSPEHCSRREIYALFPRSVPSVHMPTVPLRCPSFGRRYHKSILPDSESSSGRSPSVRYDSRTEYRHAGLVATTTRQPAFLHEPISDHRKLECVVSQRAS